MVSEIVIAIVSAVIGGLITIMVTYFNIRAKRFELEYNYRKKLEERYLLNTQKHLNDIYIPLYQALTVFQNRWIELKNTRNIQDLKNEIYKLESLKKNLEESGLTAFLTVEIEDSFDRLLDFLNKSLDASQINYGIVTRYQIMGQEISSYRTLSQKNYTLVELYRLLLH